VGNNYAIEVENLTVKYGDEVALEDINFKLEHPSFLTIIGPNGSGKTTLLRTILGLIKPEKGYVKVLNIDVLRNPTKARHMIGYVPQRERISVNIPIRVADIVLMGRLARFGPLTTPSKYDMEKVKEALELVGMVDFWDKRFSSLSGGQQQRVLIARALAVEPKMLILDEPFSAVDIPTQREILNLLYNLRIRKGITVVMVTHDVNPVIECSDKIMILNKKLIAYGTPDEVIKDENLLKAYGVAIKIIPHEGICYVLSGDTHA